MKLGVGSYTYPWHIAHGRINAFDLVNIAIQNGLGVVQICDNLPLHKMDADERLELANHAKQKNIQIEVGTRGLTLKNVRTYMGIAQQFASPFLRVVIDAKDYEPELPEIIDLIHALLPDLKAAHLMLAIENHDRFRAQDLRQIVESTDTKYVKICLDGANSLGAAEDLHTVVAKLAVHVINLHLKDFTITRIPSQLGFMVEGAASGDGMLDIPLLRERLDEHISAIVELWTPKQETPEATMALEMNWANKSIMNMKAIGL